MYFHSYSIIHFPHHHHLCKQFEKLSIQTLQQEPNFPFPHLQQFILHHTPRHSISHIFIAVTVQIGPILNIINTSLQSRENISSIKLLLGTLTNIPSQPLHSQTHPLEQIINTCEISKPLGTTSSQNLYILQTPTIPFKHFQILPTIPAHFFIPP